MDYLNIILMTLLPFLELRASIPYGILVLHKHWLGVATLAIITNIVLGVMVYTLMDFGVRIITRIAWLNRLYQYYVKRTQHKIQKYVDKYGELGVAVFIGIPLPGSGVYSGSLGAYLVGLSFKKFIIANIIGVLIAGTFVTIVSLTGSETLKIFLKV